MFRSIFRQHVNKSIKTMNDIFLVLVLVSIVGLIAGLIKPSIVKMKSRKDTLLVLGGSLVVFFILFGATMNPSTPGVEGNQPSQDATPQSAVNLTDQQKLDNAVKSILGQSSGKVSYKSTSIEGDDSDRPKNSKFVTIDVDTGELYSEDQLITNGGKLAANMFQQAFPINPNFYDVLVRYYGQVTDQYGNTTSSMLMSYAMDRPLYSKINWSGLADVENDIHLCAFLREQENILPADNTSKLYIGCAVIPSNLRKAENAIETGNSQYKDIPQYGL